MIDSSALHMMGLMGVWVELKTQTTLHSHDYSKSWCNNIFYLSDCKKNKDAMRYINNM